MIKNFEYCKYTYLHRKALIYYIKTNKYLTKLEREELLKRAKIHDMDKLTLYLFWEKKEASAYHRKTATHHLKENTSDYEITELDYLECIFDCECAALTKTDKPLNANDTFKKWYPEYYDKFLPLLKRLHMNSSYCAITDDAINYINSFDITEDILLEEVAIYLAENETNIYTDLKEKCCLYCEYENLIQLYQKYCIKKLQNFNIDKRKYKTYHISKYLNSENMPIFNNENGVFIYFKDEDKHCYFTVNSNNIIGKFSKDVITFENIDTLNYEQPFKLSSNNKYLCQCGYEFKGKKHHCDKCNMLFLF